jgi:hypothetical protein
MQILLVRRGSVLRHQGVIGQAEHARREQLLPVAILGEGPWLPHQPVDHVPVVHPLLVPATQTRQPFDQLLRVPHLDLLGGQPGLDHLADQPARHRVAVSLDVDQAALIHPTAQLLERLQPSSRQWSQPLTLLLKPLPTASVQLTEQPPQKLLVLHAAREVPAAAQQEGLFHRLLESPVPLLDVAVLVGVACLDLLGQQRIMIHQSLVAACELLLLRQVVDRGAQPIRPMSRRHTA